MADNNRKPWFSSFCWIGFLITFGAGAGMVCLPRFFAGFIGIELPSGYDPFFIRLLGLVLLSFSVCYLLAIYDPEASVSLLFALSTEKALAVIYCLVALISGGVNYKILGVVIGDGALAIVGIYSIIYLKRIELWTDDEMNQGEEKKSS